MCGVRCVRGRRGRSSYARSTGGAASLTASGHRPGRAASAPAAQGGEPIQDDCRGPWPGVEALDALGTADPHLPGTAGVAERTPDGRRGLKGFVITFEPRGSDTSIVTENKRLPYALSQKFAADVGRWVQGDIPCEIGESRGRGSTSVRRAPVSAPR